MSATHKTTSMDRAKVGPVRDPERVHQVLETSSGYVHVQSGTNLGRGSISVWAPASKPNRIAIMSVFRAEVFDLFADHVESVMHTDIGFASRRGISWNPEGTALLYCMERGRCVLSAGGLAILHNTIRMHHTQWNQDGSLTVFGLGNAYLFRKDDWLQVFEARDLDIRDIDVHPTKPWIACCYDTCDDEDDDGSDDDDDDDDDHQCSIVEHMDILNYSVVPPKLLSSSEGCNKFVWSPDGEQAYANTDAGGVVINPEGKDLDAFCGDFTFDYSEEDLRMFIGKYVRWEAPGLICTEEGFDYRKVVNTRSWCRTDHHQWHNTQFRAGARALLLAGHQGQIGRMSQC